MRSASVWNFPSTTPISSATFGVPGNSGSLSGGRSSPSLVMPSWEAFDRGDWDEAMRLLEERREDLKRLSRGERGRRDRAPGGSGSFPCPSPPISSGSCTCSRSGTRPAARSASCETRAIADLEDQGPLPDIYTMDRHVMYQAVYDERGVLEYALRYTDQALVSRCRDFIAGLYGRGEPIGSFFEREIAHLPPPRPAAPVTPRRLPAKTGPPPSDPLVGHRLLSESEHPSTGAGEVRSEIEHASVTGDVVQARDVSGGVHFHAAQGGSRDPQGHPAPVARRCQRLRQPPGRTPAADAPHGCPNRARPRTAERTGRRRRWS